MVERLLEHGADVHVRNSRDETPLSLAVMLNSPEVVKLLLEHGADPETRTFDIPLLAIADAEGWTETATLLKHAGAKVEKEQLLAVKQRLLEVTVAQDLFPVIRYLQPNQEEKLRRYICRQLDRIQARYAQNDILVNTAGQGLIEQIKIEGRYFLEDREFSLNVEIP